MSQKKELIPPEPSFADLAHSLAKAALSAIPAFGGPASELFTMLIVPPLERLRQTWMEEVGKGLSGLLSRNLVTPDELIANGAFIDTILQASQVAMRTVNEEKRAALMNAVLNSALPDPPDESIRPMFLALVDQFTPWHLRLLMLFQDPKGWARNTVAILNPSIWEEYQTFLNLHITNSRARENSTIKSGLTCLKKA
jgi:hypothetical protein